MNIGSFVRRQTRLLWKIALSMLLVSSTQAALMINEVDYDQVGTDSAEFIELFNSGNHQLILEDYRLDLINGSTASTYRSFDLSGLSIDAGGYLVLCGNNLTVMNCSLEVAPSNNLIQNGGSDGDGIALYQISELIDSLTYEGILSPFTEGPAATPSDSNGLTMSLSRLPNGIDLDQNGIEFVAGCLTPGSANQAGNGDCSINTIPLTSTIWLLACGFFGMLRYTNKHAVSA